MTSMSRSTKARTDTTRFLPGMSIALFDVSLTSGLEALSMQDLLELIHDYRDLRAQNTHRGLPEKDRARMVGLGKLLGELAPWERGATPQKPVAYPVRYTVGRGFALGEVRRINGGGMSVLSSKPPPVGARTLLRVDDPRGHTAYVFPARVVWRRPGKVGAFGLIYDGAPERGDAAPTRQLWSSAMSVGRETMMA